MIYLDNSATTQPWTAVLESYTEAAKEYYGNPSSLHNQGAAAETLLIKARESMASLLHAKPKELIFTSGGTEGNNLAIKGTAYLWRERGRHLVTTTVEHPSVEQAFQALEREGFDVTRVRVNQDGCVDPDDIEEAVRADTILVSVIHVNNELGTIQPIEEIGERLKKFPKVFFHTDHVQGGAKVPLELNRTGADLITISGHKFHGLKGTGILYKRNGIKLSSLIHGGPQEHGLRAGTENLPGIIAMAKALRLAMERYTKASDELTRIKDACIKQLQTLEGVVINTPRHGTAPHIINFSIPGLKPEVVVQALSKKGIYVATKSACSSKTNEPSSVLIAMGFGMERATSAIRVSLSCETSKEDVEHFVTTLLEIIPEMRRVMGAK